jgi:hypothetical protein
MKSLSPYQEDLKPVPRTSTAHGEAALEAAGEHAGQLVRVSAQLAMMNPRNILERRQELMESCQRPAFADSAEYEFPRGGKKIRGPSVDLARESARCWRNVQYGFTITSQDRLEVQLQGFAWDMEANLRIVLEDRFRRLQQRVNADTGETEWVEPDERDFRELINRRGAILVRNCILQVLPPDIVEEAVFRCRDTIKSHARGALKKDRTAVTKDLSDAFRELGVTPTMIEAKLGHKLALLSAEEVAELRAIWKSIRDGQSRRDEHFDMSEGKKKAGAKRGRKKKEPEQLDDLIPDDAQEEAKQAPPPGEANEFAGWAEEHGQEAQDPG